MLIITNVTTTPLLPKSSFSTINMSSQRESATPLSSYAHHYQYHHHAAATKIFLLHHDYVLPT
jgi:hypothetical protein